MTPYMDMPTEFLQETKETNLTWFQDSVWLDFIFDLLVKEEFMSWHCLFKTGQIIKSTLLCMQLSPSWGMSCNIEYAFRKEKGKVGFIYKFHVKYKGIILSNSKSRCRIMCHGKGMWNVMLEEKASDTLQSYSVSSLLIDTLKKYLFFLLSLPMGFTVLDRCVPALLVSPSLTVGCLG